MQLTQTYSLNIKTYHTKATSPETTLIVVIPCYNEPHLLNSLQSLYKNHPTKGKVEVITVINSSENVLPNIKQQNNQTLQDALQWTSSLKSSFIHFSFIEATEIPEKIAGVGMARKIGMDEAYKKLDSIKNNEGVIVCFDADATCAENYLSIIENHFNNHPETTGCSIYFEHPIAGNDFSTSIYEGIIQYELHLRYHKEALAFAGLPFAYHTVGSSMAVRANIYHKQGGMNKRKAGEDFYFLQKVIPLGNFSEINNTVVYPSPRVSDRVPFGTGKAMGSWLENKSEQLNSYHFSSFLDLKILLNNAEQFYFSDEVNLPDSITSYLKSIDFQENLEKIRRNATNKSHFVSLFFKWFNAFKVLKYLHFSRDNFYGEQPINQAANLLLNTLKINTSHDVDELLLTYRKLQLKQIKPYQHAKA